MTCPLCNDTGEQRYWEGRWRDVDAVCAASTTTIAELRAINADLLEALREIADHSPYMSDWPHTTEAMQRIARAAIDEASRS